MPWSTPKTDWGAGDGVANTDLNRIEGNAQYLKDDIDSHKAKTAKFTADYDYQTPTIVGTQIRLVKQSDTNILKFKLDADLSGGEITISLDGGATSKPLVDIDGVAVTELNKGFVEVIEDAVNFTHAPKGGKLIGTAQPSDVLLGETFMNADGEQVGTMKLRLMSNLMLKMSQSASFGGTIFALAFDGTYLYAGGATTNTVWKIDPTTMTKVAETTSIGIIRSLLFDGGYLYIGNSTRKVWKVDPTTMSKVAESINLGGEGYALEFDGTHLYVGGGSNKNVWKIDPQDMSKVGEILFEGFPQALCFDGTHLYIGGTNYTKIWKVNPSNMLKVAETGGIYSSIYAFAFDGTHLYGGGTSTAGQVAKISPWDMQKISSIEYGGGVRDLEFDGSYLYAGGNTTNAVWKINRGNMSKISEISYAGGIWALACNDMYIYAGGDTNNVWKILHKVYVREE